MSKTDLIGLTWNDLAGSVPETLGVTAILAIAVLAIVRSESGQWTDRRFLALSGVLLAFEVVLAIYLSLKYGGLM